MEKHRTGGMTAIAVLTIIVGVVEILGGLFQLAGALTLIYNMLELGVFDLPIIHLLFSFLLLATGIVGLIAGIGMLAPRPSARELSLVFAGLLIFSAVLSFFTIPIIASIATYDLSSLSAGGWARLIIFSVTYVVLPVSYALLLLVVFSMPAWKATFAKGSTA